MTRSAGDATTTTTTQPNIDLGMLGNQVRDFATRSLSGTNPANPFIDDIVNRSSRNIVNTVQSNFAGAGRSAGGVDPAGVATDRLIDLNAVIRGPMAEAERNRSQNTFSNILAALGNTSTQSVPLQTNVGGNILSGATLGQMLFPNNRFSGLIGGGIGGLFS